MSPERNIPNPNTPGDSRRSVNDAIIGRHLPRADPVRHTAQMMKWVQ